MYRPPKEDDMVNLGPTEPYQPRPGDLGLTQISGWGGKAIRLGQWLNGDGYADYEHTYVVTGTDPDGTVWIVEAMPGGAQHVGNWHDPARTRYLVCPDEYREAVASIAVRQADRKVPYSALDYEALALHRFHVPAPGLRAYIESSGHQICSQLADYCAAKGGWHLFNDNRWPGYVTPGDLNRLWEQQNRSENSR
jgi:hypothetical protein